MKILDALAAGTPTVTTTYGNEGIGASPGKDLLVADDPAGFSAAVIRLLKDSHFAEQIAGNGRNFVREHYTVEASVNKLESLYYKLSHRTR